MKPIGNRWVRLLRPHPRSEEHTSELQSRSDLVCRLLLEKKKKNAYSASTSNLTYNDSPDCRLTMVLTDNSLFQTLACPTTLPIIHHPASALSTRANHSGF